MRLNKNAHCFAVEPSGWRYAFDASIFASLLRHDVPFDSPRVHQKTTATAVVFVYGGGRTLRLTASEERSKRLHLRKSNAADIANNRTQSVKCKALARMRGC